MEYTFYDEELRDNSKFPVEEFGMMEPASLPVIRKGYSKSKLKELADAFVSTLMEYGGNPLEAAEVLSSLETMSKAIKDDERFKQSVIDELLKHKGKFTASSGAKLETCEVSIEYDYSKNATWMELNNEIQTLVEQKKELEDKLKKIPAGSLLVDAESGETLIGPIKYSKSSFKVTLSK